jgi:hypothetical protein
MGPWDLIALSMTRCPFLAGPDQVGVKMLGSFQAVRIGTLAKAAGHMAPFGVGEIGPDLFRHACLMGLEGLVSKHRESP